MIDYSGALTSRSSLAGLYVAHRLQYIRGMARKNIAEIINAFKAGSHAQCASCRTDGHIVWSYAMPIAARAEDGRVMIVRRGPSRTTNGQINSVRAAFEADGYDTVDEIRVTDEGVVGI